MNNALCNNCPSNFGKCLPPCKRRGRLVYSRDPNTGYCDLDADFALNNMTDQELLRWQRNKERRALQRANRRRGQGPRRRRSNYYPYHNK